jgi:4'-phosphopantetheinyl transferase
LIGVSTAGGIGDDVEPVRPGPDCDRLIRRFFSARERTAWRELVDEAIAAGIRPADAQARRRAAFFSAWVRKEAYVKGRGEGIARGLDTFSVTIGPQRPPRLIEDRRDPSAPLRWGLADLEVAPGYAAAAAYEGRESG